MIPEVQIYGVYDRDEVCVCVGTAEECAKFLGMTKGSFYCKLTRQNLYENNHFNVKRLFKEKREGMIDK